MFDYDKNKNDNDNDDNKNINNNDNKIWWLCLVPTSTTRFVSDLGYCMAKNVIELCKEIIHMNNDI